VTDTHHTVRASKRGQCVLDQGHGCHHVDLEHSSQFIDRVLLERRQRGRTQGARVVNEEVQRAQLLGRRDQRGAMLGVGHVADENANLGPDGAERTSRLLKVLRVSGVDDQIPAVTSEVGGERPPESFGGSGDDGDGHDGLSFPTRRRRSLLQAIS
jgi:hypothetical protein